MGIQIGELSSDVLISISLLWREVIRYVDDLIDVLKDELEELYNILYTYVRPNVVNNREDKLIEFHEEYLGVIEDLLDVDVKEVEDMFQQFNSLKKPSIEEVKKFVSTLFTIFNKFIEINDTVKNIVDKVLFNYSKHIPNNVVKKT